MKQLDLFKLPKVENKKGKKGRRQAKKLSIEMPIMVRPEWPYEYIKNTDFLPSIAEDLSKQMAIGLDIETYGLDPYVDEIRLVQLSREGKTYLLDYGKMGTIGPVSEVLKDGPLKVGHSLQFENKMISKWFGYDFYPQFCTMTGAKLINAGQKKFGFKLVDVVLEYLGVELDKTEQTGDWSQELTERQLVYAALDSECPLKMHPDMMRKLNRMKLKDTAFLEFELLPAVAAMELAGIRVNEKKWQALADENEIKRDNLFSQLQEMAEEAIPGRGYNFNPRSHIQVREVLKAQGLEVTSTAVDNIKRFHKEYPFIELLLEFRELQNRVSTFGSAFLDHIHEITGRIHPDFWPLGTDTGRYSCSNPNLNNIPNDPRWRECFIPAEGFVYSIFDYSQIELRIAACIANDSVMLRAYREGIDLHRLTAATIYGCKVTEVTPAQRQASKAINFGLIYGMSAETLMVYAKNSYGVNMTIEEAKRYRTKFFQKYRGLKAWHSEAYRIVDREVVQMRTIGGRLRKWADNKPWITHLLNTPVQGTAADGMKAAHVLLYNALKSFGYDARIVNVIHDEFIVEVREDLQEDVAEIQRGCMKKGMEVYVKDVPVVVEGGTGSSWASK